MTPHPTHITIYQMFKRRGEGGGGGVKGVLNNVKKKLHNL